MDSKKTTKEEVELALTTLREKIESLQAKVDKLCETSGCFKTIGPSPPKKDEK